MKAREITKLDTNTSGRYKNLPFLHFIQYDAERMVDKMIAQI